MKRHIFSITSAFKTASFVFRFFFGVFKKKRSFFKKSENNPSLHVLSSRKILCFYLFLGVTRKNEKNAKQQFLFEKCNIFANQFFSFCPPLYIITISLEKLCPLNIIDPFFKYTMHPPLYNIFLIYISCFPLHTLLYYVQGCNARKVISEVYTSLVLQCTVFGR